MTKLDLTKTVQTRDGRKARIICTDKRTCGDMPIICLVDEGTYEEILMYDKEGNLNGILQDRNLNLINIPETPEEKPFDYKLPVQQRCGRPAWVLADDISSGHPNFSLLVKYEMKGGKISFGSFNKYNGKYFNDNDESERDLVNIPTEPAPEPKPEPTEIDWSKPIEIYAKSFLGFVIDAKVICEISQNFTIKIKTPGGIILSCDNNGTLLDNNYTPLLDFKIRNKNEGA